jgi:hypothetical protein
MKASQVVGDSSKRGLRYNNEADPKLGLKSQVTSPTETRQRDNENYFYGPEIFNRENISRFQCLFLRTRTLDLRDGADCVRYR